MKKAMAIILLISLLLASGACAENAAATLQDLYAQAELAMALGDYSGAGAKFEALGAYSDASQMAMYCKAIAAAETLGMYDVAISAFDTLDDFRDCKQMSVYYQGRKRQAAAELYSIENITDEDLDIVIDEYKDAIEIYSGLALFKDCLTRVSDCKIKLLLFIEERDKRENERLEAVETAYQAALILEANREYNQAIATFTEIVDYKDSREHIEACQNAILEENYQDALVLKGNGEYQKSIDIFNSIIDYKDSSQLIIDCYSAMFPELGLYNRDALRAFEELKFYFDITLDMPLKDIKRIISNNGYTVIDSNLYSYTELKKAFGLDYLALCFYTDKNDKLWKMVYMSGNYNNADLVKAEYADACFSSWQTRLESQFGSPQLTENEDDLLSPQKMGVGLEIANHYRNREECKFNQWIIRLKDNNLVSIINGVFKATTGWFHEVEFVLIPETNINKSVIQYATKQLGQ